MKRKSLGPFLILLLPIVNLALLVSEEPEYMIIALFVLVLTFTHMSFFYSAGVTLLWMGYKALISRDVSFQRSILPFALLWWLFFAAMELTGNRSYFADFL